jgi:hypothetical protein
MRDKPPFTSSRSSEIPEPCGYGWYQGAAWWDYRPPSVASGPDRNGWQHFIVATIYQISHCGLGHRSLDADSQAFTYMAVPYGCHWKKGERQWAPTCQEFATLKAAMEFCEQDLADYGVIPRAMPSTDPQQTGEPRFTPK